MWIKVGLIEKYELFWPFFRLLLREERSVLLFNFCTHFEFLEDKMNRIFTPYPLVILSHFTNSVHPDQSNKY